VEGLQLFMMPLAMFTLVFSLAFPGEHIIHDLGNPAFALHVLVSIVAYSLFAIAALLAVLMLFLEKALHDKRWLSLVRQLPPLLSLEKMMFQVIGIGFMLLTVSLLTGIVFLKRCLAKLLPSAIKQFFRSFHGCCSLACSWGAISRAGAGRWRYAGHWPAWDLVACLSVAK
jgi:ABC-type uncharacterized transport system permease subunit